MVEKNPFLSQICIAKSCYAIISRVSRQNFQGFYPSSFLCRQCSPLQIKYVSFAVKNVHTNHWQHETNYNKKYQQRQPKDLYHGERVANALPWLTLRSLPMVYCILGWVDFGY